MKKCVFSFLLLVSMFISLLNINIYAEETANNNNQTTQAFDNLTRLTPEHVQSLIDELNNQAAPTPRLTEDDILSERKIFTTDNSPLRALTLRQLTPYEIKDYLDATYVYSQTMTLYYENEEDLTPTSSYNCHYYAWCRDWCDEEYWIDRAEPIVDDVHTNTFLNEEYVQIGDIVTYWANDECKHSAIVYSIVNGQIYCRSKWGANGLFIHPIDDVPSEYKENGQKNVKFHRYDHGIHFWGWNNVSDTHHEWKCYRCTATTDARAPHAFQNIDRYNDSGHQMYCYDCSYAYYEDHDLYVETIYGEDNGCDVACRDCSYSFHCACDPEITIDGSAGHYVDCPDGEFSYYEEHVLHYTRLLGDLFHHNASCTLCEYSSLDGHSWVWNGITQLYVCSDCGYTTDEDYVPGIMSLPDPELEAYLASLSDEERDAFIASLPEDQVARVTALLPSNEDYVTE